MKLSKNVIDWWGVPSHMYEKNMIFFSSLLILVVLFFDSRREMLRVLTHPLLCGVRSGFGMTWSTGWAQGGRVASSILGGVRGAGRR